MRMRKKRSQTTLRLKWNHVFKGTKRRRRGMEDGVEMRNEGKEERKTKKWKKMKYKNLKKGKKNTRI